MKENSIVIELQILASDPKIKISELLRKALLVSSKLKLKVFAEWIRCELNGFDSELVNIPEYRRIFAHLQGQNPIRGLIPLAVPDPELSAIVNNVILRQSAESIESLLQNNSDQFHLTIPEQLQVVLMEFQSGPVKFRAIHTITRDQVVSVLGAIRTAILEWSISLEDEGIYGYGLTFSTEDAKKAMSNQHINISNFQGVIGDIKNSSLTQNLTQSINRGDFESLANYLRKYNIMADDINELQMAINADPMPTELGKFGAKVSQWIGNMLTKAANGTWQVAIGAAGNLLADGVTKFYN